MLRTVLLLCVVGASGCATSGRPQHYKGSPLEAYGYIGPGLDVVMGKKFKNCGVFKKESQYLVKWFRLRCARSALDSGEPFLFGYVGHVPPDVFWNAAVLRADDKLVYVSLSYNVAGWDFVVGQLTTLSIPKMTHGNEGPFDGKHIADHELSERIGTAIKLPFN